MTPPATTRPVERLARPVASGLAGHVAILVGLIVAAVIIRWPHLQTIPAFTDEVEDVYRALQITRGELYPLVDAVSSYNGSLWNWVLAGVLLASDFSLYGPRLVVLTAGVLTVAACYPLGLAWTGSRLGAALSAGLLATLAGHVAVNSHVAWGNCVTPLFTTLAFWTLWRSIGSETEDGRRETETDRGGGREPEGGGRRDGGRKTQGARRPGEGSAQDSGLRTQDSGLVFSGLLWGLALQTHWSVATLLPGAALFLIWRRPDCVRRRSTYLAAGLFLLVNLNTLVYNVASGFESVSFGLRTANDYTRGEALTPGVYLTRLGRVGLALAENLAGAIDDRPTDLAYLADPGLWPTALLAAGGLVFQWRRRNPLPVLLAAGPLLVLPLFNGRFDPLLDGRYLAPLMPVLLVGSAGLLVSARSRLCCRAAALALLPAALACFVLLHPLVYLGRYYEQVAQQGLTNGPFFAAVDGLAARRGSAAGVLVDRPLLEMRFGPGDGRLGYAFVLALSARKMPYAVVNLALADAGGPGNRCQTQFVVLASRRAGSDEALFARLDLRALDGAPARLHGAAERYGVYRLERSTEPPPVCPDVFAGARPWPPR